ncbi:MAG: hypothetical protein RLZZ214_1891 [Verrucomicrobiota bacterium]|jgi:autotransporter-associated beta strand protein
MIAPGAKPPRFPAAIAAALALLCPARAATWDITPGSVGGGNGTTTGGSGTWNTTNGNWTVDAGANNIAWNNATNDPSIFSGTAGAVDLTTGITAGSVTFNTTGYSVTGNVLTLGGATPTISVGTGLAASISSEITGAVLNIGTATTGLGSLTLSGANTHTGLTNVNFGTVNVQNSSAFGSTTAGTAVTNGAGLSFQGGVNVLSETLSIRGAGVGNAGALRNISGNNGWTGLVTLTNSLRITSNSGTLTLGAISAVGRTIIMNGAGNVTVEGEISGAGGAVTVDNAFDTANPSGTLTLKGADTFTGVMTVTNGTLSLEGNRTAASGAIIIGNGAAQTGTLNLSIGNFSTGANNIVIGSSPAVAAASTGIGIVNHTAGTLSTSGLILLGNTGNSDLANSGTGTYHLSGGKLSSSSDNLAALCLGTNSGGTGSFNLSATGTLEMTGTGLLQIGRSSSDSTSSTGTFSQTGGTATLANMAMGNASNSNTTSTLMLTGGTFFVSTGFTAMAAGTSSTASITIGGTADVTLPPFPTLRGTGSTATLTFDGGILRPTAASTAYIGGLSQATIQDGGATLNVATGRNITISQNLLADPVSTGGGLTKLGLGALTLAGDNTYTGPTTVTAGNLILAASGKTAAVSPVTVAAGATLGGSGIVAGTVSSSGTISPGTNVGTLSTGTANLTGGTLAIEVSGSSADRLLSSGVISLSGVSLSASEITSGSAISYVIAQGSSITGTFVSSSLPAGYSIEYKPTQVILKLALTIKDYPTWSSVRGLDSGNDGLDMDPDGDLVNNLMEYVLGGSPVGAGSGDMSMLPSIASNETYLFFNFDRTTVSMDDTIQSVSISNDLVHWNEFAGIGSASEGAVSISGIGDEQSVSVAVPHSHAVAGKLFARLEVAAAFPIIAEEPGMTEICRYWAPVVYQDIRGGLDITRQLYGARDTFVAMNFDGDWDVANNWHNSRYQPYEQGQLVDRLTPPLRGKAYSAMVESQGFYFLTYGFYHSGQDSYFSAARHQNDWETVVLVVRKDGTRNGKLEGMMTQFHTDQYSYLPSQIQFSEHRPIIYIEPNGGLEGHGIKAYSNQNPGSDGVVYIPASSSENVTSMNLGTSGNWNTAPRCQYNLVPISEMWGLIGRTALNDPYSGWKIYNYARDANYPDYEHEPAGGNPPWDRDFFEDPFAFFAANFPALQAELAADSYLFNPYFNGQSSQSGPGNANGFLPATQWQKTQLGGTSGLTWNHRGETTLYHRNVAGTDDRLTFSHVPASGDFVIQGRMHSVQAISNSFAGLMIRNTTADTSRMISLLVGADQRVRLQYRTADGGSPSAIVDGPEPATDQPVWLRLERTGGNLITSYSYQEFGGSFTVLAAIPIAMDAQVFAGMAMKSSTATYYSASTMTNLEVIPTP